ncbi:hypothetical protein LCGC14_0303390 [marine sediment metagenome]|uniref:AAA+ ATPase domain-containing protein n=1 Tax=marine sediment metagenome TaxID=412755 RepID=A0A0F9WVV0_9ZZZZ|nr:ATP-binding protein [bacterium]
MTRDHRRSVNKKPTNVKGKSDLTTGEKRLLGKIKKHPVSPKKEDKQARMDDLNTRDVYAQMITQQKALIKDDPARKAELNTLIEDYQDKIDDIDAKLGLESVPKTKPTKEIGTARPKIQKIFQETGPKNEEAQEAEQIARAWIIEPSQIKSNGMNDIIGHNAAKIALKTHIKVPLIAPQFFDETKKPNRTFLFVGPPGTGKTELAKAAAKDANINFMEIRASDLLSKYFGTPSIRVKALFREAAKRQPILIFIDEADDLFDRTDEKVKKIANEFYKAIADLQMSNERMYVIAATNKPENLDGGAIRRFTPIPVNLPLVGEREAMFETRTRTNVVKVEGLDYAKLAAETDGYSGSDIAAITSDALSKPLDELVEALGDKDLNRIKGISPDTLRPVTMDDFLEIIDKKPPTATADELAAIDAFWRQQK